MGTTLKFNQVLTESDPHKTPVLIIGQLKHLSALKFEDVQIKLHPRVTEEVNIIIPSNHEQVLIKAD